MTRVTHHLAQVPGEHETVGRIEPGGQVLTLANKKIKITYQDTGEAETERLLSELEQDRDHLMRDAAANTQRLTGENIIR